MSNLTNLLCPSFLQPSIWADRILFMFAKKIKLEIREKNAQKWRNEKHEFRPALFRNPKKIPRQSQFSIAGLKNRNSAIS